MPPLLDFERTPDAHRCFEPISASRSVRWVYDFVVLLDGVCEGKMVSRQPTSKEHGEGPSMGVNSGWK